MVATMFNQNAELIRRIAEIAKTRDTLQLLTNWKPQVVVVANDSMLLNPFTLTAARTTTGTSNMGTNAGSPSQVWITAIILSLSGTANSTESTAAIRAVVNGQTVTIAIINIAAALAGEPQSNSIALSFTHPVRVDADTNISLTTVQSANTFVRATVHTITNRL